MTLGTIAQLCQMTPTSALNPMRPIGRPNHPLRGFVAPWLLTQNPNEFSNSHRSNFRAAVPFQPFRPLRVPARSFGFPHVFKIAPNRATPVVQSQ